jgi:diguanylate cyclase (GGDEF)-like protein
MDLLSRKALEETERSSDTPPLLPPTDVPVDMLLRLLEATPQPMAAFDDGDRLRWSNQAFRQAYGLKAREWPTWMELLRLGREREKGTRIVTDDFEAWLASAKSRRGKLPYRAFEADLVDGRWLLMAECTLRNGWMLCVATDISDFFADGRALRAARDKAMRAALTDDLTQLPNRRSLAQQLRMLEVGAAAGFTLVLLDIDHFKRVNDTYGHDIGDVVIQHFASQIRHHSRRDDVLGRWGGEEFLLVVCDRRTAVVEAVMTRLLAAAREALPCPTLPELRYTASAGLATLHDQEEIAGAVRRADQALYEAKSQGRDCWVWAPGFDAAPSASSD